MPFTYSWLIKGQVIMIEGYGEVSVEDLEQDNEVIQSYLDESDARFVHIVGDMAELQALPPIREFTINQWANDPRIGWFVLYGMNNRSTNFILAASTQMLNLRTRTVKSLPDATRFLRRVDESIVEKPEPALVS